MNISAEVRKSHLSDSVVNIEGMPIGIVSDNKFLIDRSLKLSPE